MTHALKAQIFVPYTAQTGGRVEARKNCLYHYHMVVRGDRRILSNMLAVAKILAYVEAECDEFELEVKGCQSAIEINLTFTSGRIPETQTAIGRALLELGFEAIEVCVYRGIGKHACVVEAYDFTPSTTD